MHPAPSVIFFTVFSGIGFGMLIFLGLGMPAVTGMTAFIFFLIAYLCAVGGLISSTFHLGHPERAMKAFTQWRSSWLSREGVCAVIALLVMGLYGAFAVFFGVNLMFVGLIGAIFSLLTVFTTSMIYTQLKTIPRWNSRLTPVMFLSFSLAGGALLTGNVQLAAVLILIAALIQIVLWKRGDGALAGSGTTLATATGLGTKGDVRAFEPPHTGTNYLLKEFAFVVGRKHSLKLRIISMALFALIPIVLLVLAPFSHLLAALAVVSHVAGAFAARWLFFAEAEHVVGLYYGMR
mmetsp:Transcript_27433/g.50531  ORF Transcript_27433/g.50531 Transcript_27433/m.50531 type:complete len:292 (-) Transcript_27433:3025-3900(-)